MPSKKIAETYAAAPSRSRIAAATANSEASSPTKPAICSPSGRPYEWKKTATGKQPYAIALADRRLMALARLWENWRSPAGERIRSFAIITTEPNELCAALHNRMPVVLKPEAWPVWLAEKPADPFELKSLLAVVAAQAFPDVLYGVRRVRR